MSAEKEQNSASTFFQKKPNYDAEKDDTFKPKLEKILREDLTDFNIEEASQLAKITHPDNLSIQLIQTKDSDFNILIKYPLQQDLKQLIFSKKSEWDDELENNPIYLEFFDQFKLIIKLITGNPLPEGKNISFKPVGFEYELSIFDISFFRNLSPSDRIKLATVADYIYKKDLQSDSGPQVCWNKLTEADEHKFNELNSMLSNS